MHRKSTMALGAALLAGALLLGTQAQAESQSGAMLSNACAGCHGTNGVSAGPGMPTIAGLPAKHIVDIMKQFRNGERHATIMDRLSRAYSDEDLAKIGEYFSKQKWGNAKSAANSKMATKVDAKLAKKGEKEAKKCMKCHDDNGRSQEDDVPRMAGQWLDYLLIKMEDYKTATPLPTIIENKKMKDQVDEKSLEDLQAIAHFYASQE